MRVHPEATLSIGRPYHTIGEHDIRHIASLAVGSNQHVWLVSKMAGEYWAQSLDSKEFLVHLKKGSYTVIVYLFDDHGNKYEYAPRNMVAIVHYLVERGFIKF